MGTYFGLHIEDSIANTRAIGAVLGGVLGGPSVGFLVGLTGGLHRYSMGGMTATACMLSTVAEGLLGGFLHSYLIRKNRLDLLFQPLIVAGITLVAEVLQMLIILAVARPFHEAVELVENIALPMMITNTIGAAMFMRILLDRRAIFEKYTTAFSAKALQIAARAEGQLRHGFDQQNSMRVARILYEELGVGAVAITDREKLLAFIGTGADHHLVGSAITSDHTHRAIELNQVVYADGNAVPYTCSISPNCKLGSTLVIPLRGEEHRVIGSIKLYEPKSKLFSSINRTLGEGIAHLLSAQILAGEFEQQKQLLAQSEIKLLHAQVNPHFLFNALNTQSVVIRRNPDHARKLVLSLSTFFRNQLPLLHEASDQARIAGVNAGGFPEVVPGLRRSPISVVFSDPQIAMVGSTFRELSQKFSACGCFDIGEVSFENQGRSRVMLKNKGILRVYGEQGTGRFLGAEMIGPSAEHIAHLLAWAHQQQMTINQMLDMPFYHPVIEEEGLRTALRDLQSKLRLGTDEAERCLPCPGD
jgi:LytS/YehU family sensor histidine kinase